MAKWFTELRPTARLTRELKLIRLALVKLAAAAERAYPPAGEAAPEPPIELANAPMDFGTLFVIEAQLTKQFGRAPDSDELVRAYEGEAEIARERAQPRNGRHK